jgi:hypothetical protein
MLAKAAAHHLLLLNELLRKWGTLGFNAVNQLPVNISGYLFI